MSALAWALLGLNLVTAYVLMRLALQHRDVVRRLDQVTARTDFVSGRATEECLFPIALADAHAIIAVIDRVPNQDDHLDQEGVPFVWMHPRLQRTWKPGARLGEWIETTFSSTEGWQGMNHMIAISHEHDTYIYAVVGHGEGCTDFVSQLNEDGQIDDDTFSALLDSLPPMLQDAFGLGTGQCGIFAITESGPAQRVAPRRRDRPVPPEDTRRPINLGD